MRAVPHSPCAARPLSTYSPQPPSSPRARNTSKKTPWPHTTFWEPLPAKEEILFASDHISCYFEVMDFHQAILTPWMLTNSHEGTGSNLGGNPDCRRLISWGESPFLLLSFPFPSFCWHPNLWPSAHWQEAGNWRPSSLVTANNSWASATSKHNDQQIPQNSRSLSKNERNKSSKEWLIPSSPCDSRISKPLLAAPTIERTLKGIQRRGAWEPGTSNLVQPTAQMSITQILFPCVLTFRMNMWDRANSYLLP